MQYENEKTEHSDEEEGPQKDELPGMELKTKKGCKKDNKETGHKTCAEKYGFQAEEQVRETKEQEGIT